MSRPKLPFHWKAPPRCLRQEEFCILYYGEQSECGVSGYLHKKHFTLQEARKELTAVHARVSKLVELKTLLNARGWDISRHRYFGGMGPNGDGTFPIEMERLVEIVRVLDEKGIIVKGIDEGLIDFPHIRDNGEEVYLCWKLGEDDILFWHRIPDGFAGRRMIEEL